MASLEGEAIVLRVVEYGESDLVAHLLMPEIGRLTVIAKHARKSRRRFPGSLDIFNHLTVRISRRRQSDLGFLEQAILRSPFLNLRHGVRHYALASYLVELLDRMAPEAGVAPDMDRLFDFALSALGVIGELEPDLKLRCFMELKAFDALGLRPELEQCVRCGDPPRGPKVGFSVPEGGVLCGVHSLAGGSNLLSVHLGTLRVLRQALIYDLKHLGRLGLSGEALAEASNVVFRFQRFHLGFELKSERFLEESLRGVA
ncbi:MAG: DNA repair protein RecO [Deltaproteobacteria bacterium]|nr:DNA repair protein RecO [Deltaproteobacteria bacterium]